MRARQNVRTSYAHAVVELCVRRRFCQFNKLSLCLCLSLCIEYGVDTAMNFRCTATNSSHSSLNASRSHTHISHSNVHIFVFAFAIHIFFPLRSLFLLNSVLSLIARRFIFCYLFLFWLFALHQHSAFLFNAVCPRNVPRKKEENCIRENSARKWRNETTATEKELCDSMKARNGTKKKRNYNFPTHIFRSKWL